MRNGKYVCWPCGNDGWTAGLVQVEQTCTLAGAAARWMLAGSLPLNHHANLLWLNPAGILALCFSICHKLYLLIWCLTISRACWCDAKGHTIWCGASLSAVPAGAVFHYGLVFWCGASLLAMSVGVVPHYRPCLLVWCLAKGHAFWCGASLSAMPFGVLSHYQPCLLVWYLTIGHAF